MFSRKKASCPQPVCPNVLTPDRIPRFFIPPSLATLQGRRTCKNESPEDQSSIQVVTTDEEKGQPLGRLYSASSMPQLSSPSGLVFLPESPHTRRRESLFHGERLPHRFHPTRFTSPLRPLSHPTLALDSDTASSTETSPYGSPLLARSPGACQAYSHRRKFVCRSVDVHTLPRPNSLSAEETSSTDTSPSLLRREKEPGWGPFATLPLYPLDLIRCHERLTKEVMLTIPPPKRRKSAENVFIGMKVDLKEVSYQQLPPEGRLDLNIAPVSKFYRATGYEGWW